MVAAHKEILEGVHSVADISDTVPVWPLSDTLTWLSVLLIIYIITVTKILPAFMKHREPYKLTNILIIYNAFQVAFSAYLVLMYTRYIWRHGIITTRCPQGNDLRQVLAEVYPYFIAKHIDLLDTVFFVLRKKDNQITFLHLYHHSVMVSWLWLYVMYHPGDHFVVVGMLNSFVHVLMYAYYGLSSLGPDYAKYVWWKKHLTTVQLVQFILVVSNLYYQQKLTPCPIPGFFHWFCILSISSFFCLFMNFYCKSYKNRKTKKDLEISRNKSSLNAEFDSKNN